ncbi:MAG: hypothetical protein M5F18_09740, partial [Asgard group archaeon]|nr:hypothetical protein [Asgard group archaeon]
MKFLSIAAIAGVISAATAQVLPAITDLPQEDAYLVKRGWNKHKDNDQETTYWVTEYAPSTTMVTVTKCSKGKCSNHATPTGVTKTTTVHSGVTTAYTTYCPLTTSHEVIKSTCSKTLVVHSTKSKPWYWHWPKPTDCDKSTSTYKPTGGITKTSVDIHPTPTLSTTCSTSKYTKFFCVYTKTKCSIFTCSGTSSSLLSTSESTTSSYLPTTTQPPVTTTSTQATCVPTKVTSCTTKSKKILFLVYKTTSCGVYTKCGSTSTLLSTSVESTTSTEPTTQATPTVSTTCSTSKYTSKHCVYTKTKCSVFTCSGTSSSLLTT